MRLYVLKGTTVGRLARASGRQSIGAEAEACVVGCRYMSAGCRIGQATAVAVGVIRRKHRTGGVWQWEMHACEINWNAPVVSYAELRQL